nr:MAG TPA: hypothetical protein [Caudoviricetes sp.]
MKSRVNSFSQSFHFCSKKITRIFNDKTKVKAQQFKKSSSYS